jgi:hypothetical protein
MAGQMLSRQVQVAPPNGTDYWGLGVTITGQGDSSAFSHGGRDEGFVAAVSMWPRLGRGLFVLTNGVSGALLNEISRAFADMYGIGAEPRPTKQVVAMDSAALAAYAGRYEISRARDTLRYEISAAQNLLRMWDPVLMRNRYLFPSGGDDFLDFDIGNSLSFQREAGQVSALLLGQGPNRRVARRVGK